MSKRSAQPSASSTTKAKAAKKSEVDALKDEVRSLRWMTETTFLAVDVLKDVELLAKESPEFRAKLGDPKRASKVQKRLNAIRNAYQPPPTKTGRTAPAGDSQMAATLAEMAKAMAQTNQLLQRQAASAAVNPLQPTPAQAHQAQLEIQAKAQELRAREAAVQQREAAIRAAESEANAAVGHLQNRQAQLEQQAVHQQQAAEFAALQQAKSVEEMNEDDLIGPEAEQ